MQFTEDDFDIRTGHPTVDELTRELVSLKPDWQSANPDYVRSTEILEELNGFNLNPYEKRQIVSYVGYHWTVATSRARELGLVASRDAKCPISQMLAGVCLVQSQHPEPAKELAL